MTNINMKMEDMMAMLESMDPEKRAEIARMATPVLHRPWLPQEGPQTEAFYCEADEMLYGGAAGGLSLPFKSLYRSFMAYFRWSVLGRQGKDFKLSG